MRLPDGSEISGERLEKLLHKMIAYQKLLQVVERRGHPRDVVEALLDARRAIERSSTTGAGSRRSPTR